MISIVQCQTIEIPRPAILNWYVNCLLLPSATLEAGRQMPDSRKEIISTLLELFNCLPTIVYSAINSSNRALVMSSILRASAK